MQGAYIYTPLHSNNTLLQREESGRELGPRDSILPYYVPIIAQNPLKIKIMEHIRASIGISHKLAYILPNDDPAPKLDDRPFAPCVYLYVLYIYTR